MKNQEIVLFAKGYSFKNDEGQLLEGGELLVLGKVDSYEDGKNFNVGHKIAKVRCSYDLAKKLQGKLPALVNVEYDVSIDRDMRPSLVPKDVEFVKEFKFTS